MTLIVPIGIPASGKSTISKEYKEQGYTIINPDSMRVEMFNDEEINNDELWEEVGRRLDLCLSDPDGKCLIDATNIQRWEREPHIEKAKKYGHKVKAVVMRTHPKVAEQLNKQRDRQVPRNVIYRMFYQMQFPEREEGFDSIEVLTFDIDDKMCRQIGGKPRGDRCVVCEFIKMRGGKVER